MLFCCECLVVGVCLCCESYLLECISFLLGSMLVNVLFASCMSVGGCSAEKASSVSCVNLSQSAFL